MLVLTRRIGERIVINNEVVLEVLEIKGNRIRLGVQAPPSVTILRQELLPREIEVDLGAEELPVPHYAGSR